jgi:flagellar protein FlaG
VIDENTNEVVREIPPEKILDVMASIMELAGLIVDERR